jgi:hypothetical protein
MSSINMNVHPKAKSETKWNACTVTWKLDDEHDNLSLPLKYTEHLSTGDYDSLFRKSNVDWEIVDYLEMYGKKIPLCKDIGIQGDDAEMYASEWICKELVKESVPQHVNVEMIVDDSMKFESRYDMSSSKWEEIILEALRVLDVQQPMIQSIDIYRDYDDEWSYKYSDNCIITIYKNGKLYNSFAGQQVYWKGTYKYVLQDVPQFLIDLASENKSNNLNNMLIDALDEFRKFKRNLAFDENGLF